MTETTLQDLALVTFPDDCRACGEPLLRAHAVPVCDVCVSKIRQKTGPACGRCGDAVDMDLDMEDIRFSGMLAEGLMCRECRLVEPDFTRAVAYGIYTNELRELIHLLKYDGVRAVAMDLGGRLAEAVLQLDGLAAQELLVIAVPLFPAAERARGYNQAQLLADRMVVVMKGLRPQWKLLAAPKVLVRQKSTESQFQLSRRARRRNLRGAFAVRKDVKGREVLLIDDILTTGSTARECARVLIKAGAAKVWIATVARAQNEKIVDQQDNPGAYVAGWDLPAATLSS